MKKIHFLFLFTIISFPAFADSQISEESEAVNVEICFVLDTTGSMTGLIDGAKRSIWSIAKNIVSLKPTPEVKFCLLGFRDRGDTYITKLTDLDSDIENIYSALKAFQAQGGGDTPESVNQALYESVNHVSWSKNKNTLKIIFLVGDAPPHMDYPEEVQYPETIRKALLNDITISTIQCGEMQDTTPIWQEIAHKSHGQYSKLIQNGNVKTIVTPMDQDFQALNIKLGLTIIPYGLKEQQASVIERQLNSQDDSQTVIADRLSFYSQANQDSKQTFDVITDLENGYIGHDDLNSLKLPKEIDSMSHSQKISHFDKLAQYRKGYYRVIKQLQEEREAYISKRQAKNGPSFDQEILNGVKKIAKRKGFNFN